MSSLPQEEGAGALRMSLGAESLRRLSHASLSSLIMVGGGGREPDTSRSLPDAQPLHRAGQRWLGRHDQGRAPGLPGHAGNPETLVCPRERTGEVESSSKGLARMKSPLRRFSRDK